MNLLSLMRRVAISVLEKQEKLHAFKLLGHATIIKFVVPRKTLIHYK